MDVPPARSPSPETLAPWVPPQSNAELGGEQAAALWRAAITKAMGDPELLIRYIMNGGAPYNAR